MNEEKLRAILGKNPLDKLSKLSVETNEERLFPCRHDQQFNKLVIDASIRANHTILFSGRSGDGNQAYIKRQDGSILGIEGIDDALKYSQNPVIYKTIMPEWYGWVTNFGGHEKNNKFLS